MRLELNVAPYVYQYIVARYGIGPYDLTSLKRNELRLYFLNMRMYAELLPLPKKPGHTLILDLGDDKVLADAYSLNKPLLRADMFFHHEFMIHMRHYVGAQESLARKWRANPSQWTKKKAIEDFLCEYGIDPDSYDFFSVYRQLNRLETADHSPLDRKLTRKYGFAPSDNQYFKLCTISHGRRKRVLFQCFSRSKEDLRFAELYIPKKLLSSEDWMGFASLAMRLINYKLLNGYTIS